jgi:transposase
VRTRTNGILLASPLKRSWPFLKNGREKAVIRTVLASRKNMWSTKKTAPREADFEISKKKGVYTTVTKMMVPFVTTQTFNFKFQEDIWEDEGHEEETREFYARARVPGDIICY